MASGAGLSGSGLLLLLLHRVVDGNGTARDVVLVNETFANTHSSQPARKVSLSARLGVLSWLDPSLSMIESFLASSVQVFLLVCGGLG